MENICKYVQAKFNFHANLTRFRENAINTINEIFFFYIMIVALKVLKTIQILL